MCRFLEKMNGDGTREREVYGVLMDYDLSSWTKELKDDYTGTSQQWPGTLPFMARELLGGRSRAHLYRHDVESLFYIMLLMCGCHTLGYKRDRLTDREILQVIIPAGETPYQNWFSQPDGKVLGAIKSCFFADLEAIELSPAFKDFRPWLRSLQKQFSRGLSSQIVYKNHLEDSEDSEDKTVSFDDETLGGHISYSSLIDPVPRLTGELQGLVIRYNPPPPPLASVGATSANV